jgi:hypothetical protein
LRRLLDDSDIGGDGGAAVADMSEVFNVGVENKGEETIDEAGE